MWMQCFVDGAACSPDESGFYVFDVPNGSAGEVFIRNNRRLPSGTPISGDIVSDRLECGHIQSWSSAVP